jgi:hypothetical protein
VVTRLEADLAKAHGELLQARARRDAAARQLESSRKLRAQGMVAQQDEDEKDSAFRVLQAEVAKAEVALHSVERQKKEAEEIERHIEEVQEQQARAREREFQEMESRRLEASRREEAAGVDAVKRDRERLLDVRAAGAGVVAWRSPSPATAFGPDPVLVITPPDGIRVRLRVATREVEALRDEPSVDLDLMNKQQYLERRFSGRLVESRPIAGEPTWSVVEIAGLPPSDAVRDLVSPPPSKQDDDRPSGIKVRLKWSAPLGQLPLFRTGLVLALIGALLLASTLRLSRSAAQEDPTT